MTMPFVQVIENISFDIFWDDLEDPDNSKLDGLLTSANTSRAILPAKSKSERHVAGNKRVAHYREKQGYTGSGQVLQSINAAPGLQHSSFEELRVECYLQSLIAKGSPPAVVDPVQTPWAVIPPVYNAFKDDSEDEDADLFLNDVIMQDAV